MCMPLQLGTGVGFGMGHGNVACDLFGGAKCAVEVEDCSKMGYELVKWVIRRKIRRKW